ncbi:AbrB/MazE/SpoVT family DNA-binding domain-containing protein [Halolamina sp. C58]|uniref:AbrB/MazE/SpoVT family DNA-binding domain-containing protein n=1 Tax=Halolamina sp. C58 TaxID=3421640 RepID=UPI003EBDFB73
METRKIQRVGGGTYTVSIPISWAEEHGVEAGETAYLYTHRDGSLIVRWGEREETALGGVDVEVGDAGTAVDRTLDAAYTAGFDRITFRGVSAAQREAITARARTLVGVDVTEESEDAVEVRWLLDDSDLTVRRSVGQLRFVAVSMHDAAMGTLAGATAEPRSIGDRTQETDRLARLVERQCSRAMVLFAALDRLDATRPQLFAQYRAARELERVGTDAAEIAHAARRSGPVESTDLAADVRAVGDDAREAVEMAADAVVDGGSTATAYEVLRRADGAAQAARELRRTVAAEAPSDGILLTRALDSVVRTTSRAETLGEIALQRAVRS